jgi:NitT/TauT family transport system substrate-binding protein
MNSRKSTVSRRTVIRAAGAGLALAGIPRFVHAQAKTTTVNLQANWLLGDNQIGEIVAQKLGYFEEEKLNVVLQPGGPSIDGIPIVASGRWELGQTSSSPSLMLAASQKIPVQCFAAGAQEHPYAFFSLPKKPIRTPKDLIGKKVGIQATGKILLSALLKKQGIAEKDVEVITIGSEMTPVMTGQVDCVTGWITNTTALKALGGDFVVMRLWDTGVKLYALPYYATTDTIQKKPEMVASFTRALSRGWAYAWQSPEKAVDIMMKEYPNLVRPDELEAVPVLNKFTFVGPTKTKGWGTFEPAVWQEQIDLYNQLQQFSAGPPKVGDVMTTAVLDATKDARPKLG